IGDGIGSPVQPIVQSLIDFGKSIGLGELGNGGNLLSTGLAVPSQTLQGNAVSAVSNVLDETIKAVDSGGAMASTVLDTINLTNPLGTGIVSGVAGDVGHGPLLESDLLNINGSPLVQGVVNSSLQSTGALVDADVAGDGHQPSQSHNLIDV